MSSPSNHDPWLFAALLSSLPNIEPQHADDTPVAKRNTKISSTASAEKDNLLPPCKILECRSASDGSKQMKGLTPDEAQESIGFDPQVLVFRYRDKVHAIDHTCPHRTYPLSRGSIYDIEDFGIRLSAGITCPGHGWAFDLHTGLSDRGTYKLGIWEVELRNGEGDEEVWVRKKPKQRIG